MNGKKKLLSIINTNPNILNEALKIVLEYQFRIKPHKRQVQRVKRKAK